jgi:hypothetical protein
MMPFFARPRALPGLLGLWLRLAFLSLGAGACSSTPAPAPRPVPSRSVYVSPADATTNPLVNETPGRLSPDAIHRVVMAHAAEVRACYDEAARADPELQGQILLSWEVLPDGSVSAPMIFRATLDNARVEECLLRQVQQWRFPPSNSQTTVDGFSFRFPG